MGISAEITCNGEDISGSLQRIIDSTDVKSVILSGTATIRKTVTLNREVRISGNGIIIKLEKNIPCFQVNAPRCKIDNITFEGTRQANTENKLVEQKAIVLNQVLENIIDACRFNDIEGCGILILRAVDTHQGNLIRSCFFKNCGTGLAVMERAEYNQINGCSFFMNDVAIYIQGGNTNVSSCIISNNGVGIHIDEGENGSHGILCGCSINHNQIPLKVTNIKNAFNITSCLFYYGKIEITRSKGVKFFNCDFSNINFNVRESHKTVASNCYLVFDKKGKDSNKYSSTGKTGEIYFQNSITSE